MQAITLLQIADAGIFNIMTASISYLQEWNSLHAFPKKADTDIYKILGLCHSYCG